MKSSHTLGTLSDRGHANNFNLIRLLAALLVIVSHSFSLAFSSGEPLSRLTGGAISLGDLAVDLFFLTSGFLVTKSLLTRADLLEFVAARALRIYPGLIVMVAVTIAVAALVSPPGFLLHPDTLRYFASTALLWFPKLTNFQLPGLFVSNHWPIAVNGSLHTLPFELRMYGVLVALWLVASLRKRHRPTIMSVAIVALAIAGAVMRVLLPEGQLSRFVFMFFTGASYFVLRGWIRIHGGLATALLVIIVVSAVSRPMFFVIYNLLLGYVLFAASYLPKVWRPRSDVSYGTYIYAFPVQQTIAALIPSVSWWFMTVIAIPVVLIFAYASWHLVEKPAMRAKRFRVFRSNLSESSAARDAPR